MRVEVFIWRNILEHLMCVCELSPYVGVEFDMFVAITHDWAKISATQKNGSKYCIHNRNIFFPVVPVRN